ncbi:MAG: cytochrome c [Steroidobacteraceae bacterium]
MIKYVIALVAGAIAGGFAGNFITHRLDEPHHHPRAVMHLLGFHRDRLDAATQAGQCATIDAERARLTSLQQEIPLAFPKAYEQDADFRKDADALGTVLQAINAVDMPAAAMGPAAMAPVAMAPVASGSSCPDATAQFKKIYDTCENCHKVYDPE